ncbi:mannose/fructose/N-acetylgalactosamine-specific phosphotransferase system component IIC [Breznakia sp. PF5-3]|uniref:PTS mannose/fructose/sorbose/N-acetylgalactosamine transporter subunit IIC n=1 Tax=unclassified Breznakia TaxID=2623764 RepID=UPI00240618FB|nr:MULTISPECIES: PTS sugar transporter subunit IIC [unclassified Breznakia]MDL2276488.1 PTS sugar transporter subunit IIC [Breznakia sp. OttesenSCG-928-G09]MDF9824248.1 mannose/fructose/N-acetylgalactosamine-specific phosphotransferase system component IIC [Breznakia sp. PM6-1]MDF9835185.1 mannose/fructose/N-acetylgalactosamine-specific phosphotransferase system component IIC [Breznakia sp. PF5-3]MDF9837297.1 mannose/fructose/N-acetylgalactosamine-specific phosphotransferase system component II
MSVLQAVLIGCVAALTQLEGGWLGECKLREPVVTGFFVGLILGDVEKGLKIGAALQMMWMGATGIGPTAQLDIGTGGTIGAAVAIMTGKGAEAAIVFGLPVAVIMQFLNTLLLTGFSGFMQVAERKVDELNFKAIKAIHYLCGFMTFLIYFSLTFIVMYFGNDAIESIVNGLPEWANNGLTAVASILPALGFALLLNIILERDLIPFLILGFVIAAYTELTMVAVAAIAVAIAWVIFLLRKDAGKVVQVSEAVVDEWED